MIIISLILAYLMVGCTISTALYILSDDYDLALYIGLIWPLGVPLVTITIIIYAICRLLCKIIGFIKKSIKKRGKIKYDNYKAYD